MLKPVENWKQVLLRAWSAYGLYALVILGLLNDYLFPYLQGRGLLNHPGFGTLVSVVAAATLFFRVMQQVSLLLPKKKG